jgi:hypothetical protein
MKPNAKILDHSYKIRVISEIANCYDYILFFENEPVIINSVSKKKYSHIDFIFMNSVHSGIEQPPKNIYSLPMSFEVN